MAGTLSCAGIKFKFIHVNESIDRTMDVISGGAREIFQIYVAWAIIVDSHIHPRNNQSPSLPVLNLEIA